MLNRTRAIDKIFAAFFFVVFLSAGLQAGEAEVDPPWCISMSRIEWAKATGAFRLNVINYCARLDSGHKPNAREVYRRRILTEISLGLQRHRGQAGLVIIGFMIDVTGHVINTKIVVASGDVKLDNVAVAAIRGIHVGPPPGGVFESRVPIRFVGTN